LAFWSAISERLASLGLVPRTRVARLTAYLAGIELVLLALKWIFRLAGATRIVRPLDRWTTVLGYVLFFLLLFLALRWFRNHVMWSVRNRLIVTYLFIGIVPMALVAYMAMTSFQFLAGQLSSYVTLSGIDVEMQRLQSANSSTAALVAKRPAALRTGPLETDESLFPGRTVQISAQSVQPKWLQDNFDGLVLDEGKVYLRAVKFVDSSPQPLAVVSSVPLDQRLLARIAADIGPLTLYVLPEKAPDARGGRNITIQVEDGKVTVDGQTPIIVSAGALPPARLSWDPTFTFYTPMAPADWKTGEKNRSVLLTGTMRTSGLSSHLSSATSGFADALLIRLAVLAVTFAIFMLLAWLIGIRLTRTLTYSVANLYQGTEHINRGDFTHRIQVHENDQLAALQRSFNSMTDSLQKLIAEQKEKERLQSELEIAHEVQAQLFPRELCGTRTLEMHGVCRPARIVSGDYYDFLAYAPEQVGIAVGDISGKGISAALLMATIHSAVRAYEQELMAPVSASSAAAYATDMRIATIAPRVARPSPSQMLWLLNRHLYQTTQPEKYATLFLGFYDDDGCCLTYSNAGHLPPIILSEDGSTRRLDVGGTVVGLFDDRGYEEQTVELYPGDIFIAFSDGMTEPENEFGEFGEERLIETIAAHRDLPLERICEMAVSAVQDWIGSTEQPDDVTLVLARRTK